MGLATSQARMLTLTSRKASLERDVALNSNRKVSLSREMAELSQEYYDLLSDEKIMFLNDYGEYKQISYQYFMGVQGGVQNLIDLKGDNEMILFAEDKVVLSRSMANIIGDPKELKKSSDAIYKAIARLCGDANLADLPDLDLPENYNLCADPKLIEAICNGKYDNFDANDLTKVIEDYRMYKYKKNDDYMEPIANGSNYQQFCPEGNHAAQWMDSFKKLIADAKFYFPIVTACAKFEYTTDYDNNLNDSEYIDTQLQNGVFQIMGFDSFNFALNQYKDTDYYLLASELSKMNDPDSQAKITAWYESEKADLSSKETYWDTLIENLSVELNSITTEIESVQSLLDDAVKNTFDWGGG